MAEASRRGSVTGAQQFTRMISYADTAGTTIVNQVENVYPGSAGTVNPSRRFIPFSKFLPPQAAHHSSAPIRARSLSRPRRDGSAVPRPLRVSRPRRDG